MVDQHTVGNVPKIHDRICPPAHEGGHPQGDLASAALFTATLQTAIDATMQLHEPDPPMDHPANSVAVLAYIDDITIVAPPERLLQVVSDLSEATKTQVYLHPASPMPEADEWRQLWKQAGSHEGITLVGQPIDPDKPEWHPSIPFGNQSYTDQWLTKRRAKQRLAMRKLLTLLNKAPPEMHMMHHIWFLMQLGWNTSASVERSAI